MLRMSSDGRREKVDGGSSGGGIAFVGLRCDRKWLIGMLGRLAVSCSLVTCVYHMVEVKVFIFFACDEWLEVSCRIESDR
jgi:hypothetical protein